MSIVTTLEYGRYKICLNPSPYLSDENRNMVAESEITIYDAADVLIWIAEARGTQRQMQEWAEAKIDRLLPRCSGCDDELPVKPGYRLFWECLSDKDEREYEI